MSVISSYCFSPPPPSPIDKRSIVFINPGAILYLWGPEALLNTMKRIEKQFHFLPMKALEARLKPR